MSTGTQKVFAVDLRGYVQAWADTLAAILTTLSGTASACEVLPGRPAEKPGTQGSYWITGAISGQLPGSFSVRIPQPAIQELLRNNKADAGVEPANLAAGLREVFERAAAQLTTSVGLPHSLQEVSAASPAAMESAPSLWLRLNSADFPVGIAARPAVRLRFVPCRGCSSCSPAAVPPSPGVNPRLRGPARSAPPRRVGSPPALRRSAHAAERHP